MAIADYRRGSVILVTADGRHDVGGLGQNDRLLDVVGGHLPSILDSRRLCRLSLG